MSFRPDPVTFEVIANALDSIADQMAITLMRSAYSPIVRDSLDYSTAVFDRAGRMLAQGLTTPLHLGSFPDAMRHLIATHGGRMKPGDVFSFNEPYGHGGMHLPDIYAIRPLFWEGRVEGYAAALAHHTDVGGLTPGSNSIHSTEIFQEGLRIPLLKLYDGGEPNETLFAILRQNVRVPDKVIGDLRAQVAACLAAERGYAELLAGYGPEQLHDYFEALLDHAEARMRGAIAAVPDGTYRFEDYIDGLGDEPKPIVLRVAVTVAGDRVIVDWTGSNEQVKAGINAPVPFTRSATYLVLRSVVGRGLGMNNEGYMRPIEVVAPPGTIVNPLEPAACATRGIVGYRMADCLLGALAQAVPDRVPAANEGGATLPSIGGRHQGRPFIYVETVLGAWGGRPDRDGLEGVANLCANQSNQPIELVEAENPLEVTRYELRPDSGGPGRFRGGLGLTREYRLLADEADLTVRSDRRDHPPYGLQGGRTGAPSANYLNGQLLPTLPMRAIPLKKGDLFRHDMAGGGGFGDPLERDPARVREDVLDGKVSVEAARRDYGVRVDPASLTAGRENRPPC
ncbi:MAG TPA: hydantoinase B/oxoprolinase family protein [Chloroflexota bacterium]